MLAFLLLNVANKITDGNLLKAKLGIFIKEQGATSVEILWTDHKSLRTTAPEPPMGSILTYFKICSTVLDMFHVAHFQNLVALYLSLNGMLP